MPTYDPKWFAGIDPGKSGAIAFLSEDGAVEVFDFWEPDILKELELKRPTYSILERVHSMPKQGVKSTFSFGMNFGWWQGVLSSQKLSYGLILPRRWQSVLLEAPPGESKNYAIAFCARRYPTEKIPKSKHGRADALCLAHLAREVGMGRWTFQLLGGEGESRE